MPRKKGKCKNTCEKKISGIYKITSPSGRIYIGKSIDIKTRWYGYSRVKLSQTKVYMSFQKYGMESHVFEIIEECENDILSERELYWQKYYNSVEEGLNCIYASETFSIGDHRKMLIGNIPEKVNDILDLETGVFYYGFTDAKKYNDYGKRVLIAMLRGESYNNTTLILAEDYENGETTESILKQKLNYNRKYDCFDKNVIIDFETKQEIGSVRDVSKFLNISEGKLRNYLNGVSYNPTNLIYKSNFENGLNPIDIGTDTFSNGIKIINIETGEVHGSIKQTAEKYNTWESNIQRYIKLQGKGKLPIMKLTDYNKIKQG